MRRYKIFGLILAIFIGLFSSAYSQSAEVDNGIIWLNSTQNLAGSWGNTPDSLATEYLATAAVLGAFKAAGQDVSSTYQNGNLWLQTQPASNTAYLTSKIISLAGTGVDVTADLTTLLSYKNADNGWGGFLNYRSANFHTALALQTLKAVNYQDQNIISNALGYLISTQNADGGWGFHEGDDSNAYMTAVVLQTLAQFKTTYNLQAPIDHQWDFIPSYQTEPGWRIRIGRGKPSPYIHDI